MHVYACSGTGPARCDGNSSTVTESSLALSRGGGGGRRWGEIVSFLEGRFIRLNRGNLKDRGVNLEIRGCHALERIEN